MADDNVIDVSDPYSTKTTDIKSKGSPSPRRKFNFYKLFSTLFILFILFILGSFLYDCFDTTQSINIQSIAIHDNGTSDNYDDDILQLRINENNVLSVEQGLNNWKNSTISYYYYSSYRETRWTFVIQGKLNGGSVFSSNKYTFKVYQKNNTTSPDTYNVGGCEIDLTATDPRIKQWFDFVLDSKTTILVEETPWYITAINFLPTIIMILIFIFLFYAMSKQTGIGGVGGEDNVFSMGKSQAKLVKSNIKFSDIAGIEEEKNELIEIVDYLKHPARYAAMGARTPKGVILYGPPGTGKTLLAKAVAGEANVPFFQVSGSAFDDMLVGVGAKRIRDLFAKARKASPAIIFIDEIDSVASKRGKFDMTGGSGLADQTINQLLAEMDGFTTKSGIVVIAATNRIDVLDDAILRPGRFDRHVQVYLPDIKEREEILKIHARNKNISSSVNFADVARRTPGMSGAQLENVLNEATLLAVRQNKTSISIAEIDEGIDRTIAGPAKKSRVITLEEKKQIAIHEAGHAIVGLYTPGSDIVEKITIIPRGQAAGYTVSNPEKQERRLQTKKDLNAMVIQLLGGRAAEETYFGKEMISTGAANDLYRVTNIVRSMIMQLGMSDISMGQLVPSEGTTNPYGNQKIYSELTAQKVDAEVEKIIRDQYKKACEIVKKNTKEVDMIVDTLMAVETILKEQIDYIHKNKKLPPEVVDAIKKEKTIEKVEEKKEKDDKKD